MNKVIVTVAVAGNVFHKDVNPAVPYSPQEIAEAVHACWNEGAAIAHLHVRDKEGVPTTEAALYEQADRLIRDKRCSIIIDHTTNPGNPLLEGKDHADIDAGLQTTSTRPAPEIASVTLGPSIVVFKDKTARYDWNRLWAEKALPQLTSRGIKPAIDISNDSQMDDLAYVVDKGLLAKPYLVTLSLDRHRTGSGFSRYSPRSLLHLVELLPPDSTFSGAGFGYPNAFEVATQSMLLGGHARVGFEDNVFSGSGKLAASNAHLVAKIVRIARDLGREIASPDEARDLLGIPKLAEA